MQVAVLPVVASLRVLARRHIRICDTVSKGELRWSMEGCNDVAGTSDFPARMATGGSLDTMGYRCTAAASAPSLGQALGNDPAPDLVDQVDTQSVGVEGERRERSCSWRELEHRQQGFVLD